MVCAICTHLPHCVPAPNFFLSWRILPTPSFKTACLIALSVMPWHIQTYIKYLNNLYANKNNCYLHKDQANDLNFITINAVEKIDSFIFITHSLNNYFWTNYCFLSMCTHMLDNTYNISWFTDIIINL